MANNDSFSTYLVVLKVHGSAIRLFDNQLPGSMANSQSYRILCHDLESRIDSTHGSGVQVFVLDKPATSTDKSLFQAQHLLGQEINSTDLAIFMTTPIHNSRKASYALDIGVTSCRTSMEDLSGEDCKKVGTAYIYLEPKFSTQGIQRMQILGIHNKAPIGQIQVEYLIVTNPVGYNVEAARPQWLSPDDQLSGGHRGSGSGCRGDLSGTIIENTVASFNYAARHGADMCELDVMCTADGVPIVFHNYTLTKQPGSIQIDELTYNELRGLRHHAIHDTNCKHNEPSNQSQIPAEASQPFPTLEEVLRDVDKSCALNIELKWAQLLPNGKSEATQYREINDFVDRILDCIFTHSCGRRILLSTFNADVAILLRLKQTTYPVLFLTTGDSQRFNDPTTKTVKNAVHFAQAFRMAGINPNVANLNEYLVRYAKDRGLLVYAWGDIKSAQAIKELRRIGTNGVIVDKIDLIKPQD